MMRALVQQPVQGFDRQTRVCLDVTVVDSRGFPRPSLIAHVGFEVDLQIAGIWIRGAVFGCVAVQTGTHTDDEVGLMEEAVGSFQCRSTGHAGVERVLRQVGLCHQGRRDQCANPVRELEYHVTGIRPSGTPANDNNRSTAATDGVDGGLELRCSWLQRDSRQRRRRRLVWLAEFDVSVLVIDRALSKYGRDSVLAR